MRCKFFLLTFELSVWNCKVLKNIGIIYYLAPRFCFLFLSLTRIFVFSVPNQAPPGLFAENWGTIHSIIVKWRPLPPSNEYGILSGYRVRYHLTRIGEEITTDQLVKELLVDSESRQALLDNLEMYGTYSIWVSAFTIKGNGPESFAYGGKHQMGFLILEQFWCTGPHKARTNCAGNYCARISCCRDNLQPPPWRRQVVLVEISANKSAFVSKCQPFLQLVAIYYCSCYWNHNNNNRHHHWRWWWWWWWWWWW